MSPAVSLTVCSPESGLTHHVSGETGDRGVDSAGREEAVGGHTHHVSGETGIIGGIGGVEECVVVREVG